MTVKTLPVMNKLLVDQVTMRVIWIAPYPLSIVPIIDPTLNYRTHLGVIPPALYQEYNQFKLFFDTTSQSLEVIDLPFKNQEEKDQASLLRLKCQIYMLLNSAFNVYSTRMNIENTNYLRSIDDKTRNDWIDVYQETFNCSKESAEKLLDFKISEHKRSIFIIESARFKMVTGIIQSKTMNELKFVFDTTNIKVFNTTPLEMFKS